MSHTRSIIGEREEAWIREWWGRSKNEGLADLIPAEGEDGYEPEHIAKIKEKLNKVTAMEQEKIQKDLEQKRKSNASQLDLSCRIACNDDAITSMMIVLVEREQKL